MSPKYVRERHRALFVVGWALAVAFAAYGAGITLNLMMFKSGYMHIDWSDQAQNYGIHWGKSSSPPLQKFGLPAPKSSESTSPFADSLPFWQLYPPPTHRYAI